MEGQKMREGGREGVRLRVRVGGECVGYTVVSRAHVYCKFRR